MSTETRSGGYHPISDLREMHRDLADPEAVEYIESWPEKHRAYGEKLPVPPRKHMAQPQLAPDGCPTTNPEAEDRVVPAPLEFTL